jgi:hypothetical protein
MFCFISKTKKIPKNEIRQEVITSYSNTINVRNEGKKHASYDRVLLKRKMNNLKTTNLCKTK